MKQEALVGQHSTESQFVAFSQAGTSAKGEYHCAECSYGIIVTRELPTCPMCGGTAWEQAAWSPFARSRALV